MKYVNKSCTEFIDELASNAATPGGGGASALVGAVGVALSMMVGNLTTGKPRYADAEQDIQKLLKKAETLKSELMILVDKDALLFEPLAKAYSIPKDDPSRSQVMEDALRKASKVPMEIMRLCAQAIEVCGEFAEKGVRGAISDAGVSAVCCKAALQGAALNVYINTKYMDNRTYAKTLLSEAGGILDKYCPMADEIYLKVVKVLI